MNLPDASEINRITGKYGGSLTKWLGVTCTSNKVSFAVTNIGSSLAYAETSAVLTDNTWHHVVCVFDGTQATATDRIKIYVDNTDEALAFNGTLPTSTYDFTLEPSNPTWYVAQSGLQLGINELRGKLDEYAIYSDVALTPSEVNDIYNGGTPNDLNTLSFTPDLWFKMGEEANFTSNWLVDNSALTNYSKRSFEFDGMDDKIELGTQSLGITGAISVSAWVKIPISGVWAAPYVQGICVENGISGINWNLTFRPPPFFNYFAFTVYHTNGTSTILTSSGVTPNDGQWHHLLATSDGTTNANGVKLFVDGVLNVQATATSTGTKSTPSVIPTIGSTSNNSWYFEGNIDEVSIFNTVVDIADIWDGSGEPIDVSAVSGIVSNYRMGA